MTIFDFDDYRDFLRKYIKKLPKQGRGEIQRIANFIGIHQSLLSQVLSESKNLTLEQAQLLAKYLGFTASEREFLFSSVQLQRAGTAELGAYFKEKIAELRQKSLELSERVHQDRQLTADETALFYSHWLYIAVWLFTSLKDGRSLDEVVSWFQIPRERAIEILQYLTETRLCVLENSRYRMGPQSIHLARGSPHLHRHHTNWRLRAIDAGDNMSAEEMMFTAPLSLSLEDFKKIRARLTEMVQEVTDVVVQSEAETMACLNMDFFLIRK